MAFGGRPIDSTAEKLVALSADVLIALSSPPSRRRAPEPSRDAAPRFRLNQPLMPHRLLHRGPRHHPIA